MFLRIILVSYFPLISLKKDVGLLHSDVTDAWEWLMQQHLTIIHSVDFDGIRGAKPTSPYMGFSIGVPWMVEP